MSPVKANELLFGYRRAKANDWEPPELLREFSDSPRFMEFKRLFELDGRNLLIAFYYDGFQPFRKDSRYTNGALYIIVYTTSMCHRAKVRNLILLGFVPGPTHVHDLRVYLRPFVDEMKRAHEGIEVDYVGTDEFDAGAFELRVALVGFLADIPGHCELHCTAGHTGRRCQQCNQTGQHSDEFRKTLWSSVLGDPYDPDVRRQQAEVAEGLHQAVENDTLGSKIALARHSQTYGLRAKALWFELDELYLPAYGARLDISRDAWIDYMHMYDGIARKEMYQIHEQGYHSNDCRGVVDFRATTLNRLNYYPVGRSNRKAFHPSKPVWSSMTRIRFVKELAPVMYADLVTDAAMDSLTKLSKMLRGWLVYEMTAEDIAEAKRRTIAWQTAHVNAHGERYTTINYHRSGHVPVHVGFTGPLVNTACNTGERKNGEYIQRTPITNGRHVDRAFAKGEARMRAAEARMGYHLDVLAEQARKYQLQCEAPILSMPLRKRARGVMWSELYPHYTDDDLRDIIRDHLVETHAISRTDARHRIVDALVRPFGMCTKDGEKYRAVRTTQTAGRVVNGDCVMVTNHDQAGDWEIGYARIRNLLRVSMQDGLDTYDLADADWFVCSDKRGPGDTILLIQRDYPLRERLFPVHNIFAKFYLAPEWEDVANPQYYYMINCTESKNEGMGWDIGA